MIANNLRRHTSGMSHLRSWSGSQIHSTGEMLVIGAFWCPLGKIIAICLGVLQALLHLYLIVTDDAI